MEKIWLARYPAGVPAEVDVNAYRSVNDVFVQSVDEFSNLPAFISMGAVMTFAELDRRSRDFAAYLQSGLGLARGARVALMMPNLLQYPVALFGVLRAGCVVVNCNPLYTSRELQAQLADSGAEAIVVLENFAHVLQKRVAQTGVRHVVTTQVGDLLGGPKGALVNFAAKFIKRMVPSWSIPGAVSLPRALRVGAGQKLRAVDAGPSDIAFLQYTGGTTGVPKGAVLTHGNIVANMQQCHAWLHPFLDEGKERILAALPLYHVFALMAALVFLKMGGASILIANPRDIPGLVKEASRQRFSALTGVNTLFNALLHNPDFARLDFSSLKLALGGGMAVQHAVAQRWKAVTGNTLIEAYGLTETSPAATANPLDLKEFSGSIGLPLPGTDIAIRDDDGCDMPIGKAGELCVRGPQVMQGYWQKPEETAQIMTQDGFLRTGDIASIDEAGFVRIVDRKKDMILVSGFNVYPNEIEDVLCLHPGVLEAGAVGVPNGASGEVVKIAVVRKDPTLTAEDVRAHCRQHLTAYKVPRIIEFRTELPKTNVGKILRRALRDRAEAPVK